MIQLQTIGKSLQTITNDSESRCISDFYLSENRVTVIFEIFVSFNLWNYKRNYCYYKQLHTKY